MVMCQPDSVSHPHSDGQVIRLATMGMFIIDTFRYLDPITAEDLGDRGLGLQIGGGGCYFSIGARMWLPPSSIQMIVDRGSDFDAATQAKLDIFNQTRNGSSDISMWHFRARKDRTTTAVNIYKGEHRGFEYLSPKIRIEPRDLVAASPAIPPVLPDWIHLICSPERALESLAQIDHILSLSGSTNQATPKLIYEPIPDSCVFENLDDCIKVLPRLHVFSPNHEEAASLLGLTKEWQDVVKSSETGNSEVILDWIQENLIKPFTEKLKQSITSVAGIGPIICIRCGAWGSIIGRCNLKFQRVPAWHSSQPLFNPQLTSQIDYSSRKIKDVTGAGNSFLGGLSAYLVSTTEPKTEQDQLFQMREAAVRGSISASVIIEQLGLPTFQVLNGEEFWNGHTIDQRLGILTKRCS